MFTMRNIIERLDAIEKVVNMNQLSVSGTGNNDADLTALLPLQTVEQVIEFEAHLSIGDIQPRLVYTRT